MRNLLLTVIAVMVAFVFGRLSAQDVQPSCDMCPTTHISKSEIDQYADLGRTDRRIDQQVRSIDIGKSNVQVAVAHRGRLAERAGRVAEHDLVTEVYYVLSGSGTVLTGPDLVNKQRRPADNRAVLYLNGPGHNAEDVRGGVVNELEAGDVFVIPAGTGHEFTRIDDHITYLMVRVDPDKVVPLMDEAASRAYLSAAR
jgi:mannose-6-phosphate isomerase-like protein (cupin superfamily)